MVEVSSFLLIIVGLSMIGGIIFGLYYTTIVSFIFDLKKRRKNPSTNFTTTREQENIQKLENVLKTKPDLIKKNSELMEDELKIYQFEKDLATHAIEKILVAAKNKTIDSFEKDRLLLKYKDQLKKLNGKMEKIQSEIDVTKLINLRNDLAFLIDNKISDIDEKIKEINLKIGTNYNIKDILLNSTRKNKSYDDSKKNINNNSFIDTEGTIGEADNLNYRELTTSKNNPTQKRKEMIIESERKKIDDLKDQVLVALDRLDKTGDINVEANHDLDTKKFTENKTFMDKDPLDKDQKKLEINEKEEKEEKEEYSNIENDKKPSNTVMKKDKSNSPTIFSSLKKFHNDNVMTTKVTFDSSLIKNSEEGGLNYGNSNSNTLKESNSLRELEIEKNNNDNDNYNKKTPLSNILNQGFPNLDHSLKSKYDNKNHLSKEQSSEDKSAASSLGHHPPHLNKKDNKNNRFKLPLAFIFSKNRKEKKEEEEEEKGKHINGEERNFEIHEERKDPLRNIVNKKK